MCLRRASERLFPPVARAQKSKGIDPGYASKLIQYGWETITEALKHGGITGMMDRLDNPSKIKCAELASELKDIMRPLYQKHQDDIITGVFSSTMMADWDADDKNLLAWRAETATTGFETTPAGNMAISEPYAGSDVARIKTAAVLTENKQNFVVNGVKKWITGGMCVVSSSSVMPTGSLMFISVTAASWTGTHLHGCVHFGTHAFSPVLVVVAAL